MHLRKALLSMLQLFAGFSFLGGAVFFFSLSFLPLFRLQISDALLSSPKVCHSLGTLLLVGAFFLIGGFYYLNRGRTLHISIGGRSSIGSKVIQKTVEECFTSYFNGKIALADLYVTRGGKLEIEVYFTPFEENLREELFASVQSRLMPLLKERFGYSKPFDLIVKSD